MAGQPQENSWTQPGQAYSQPPAGGAQQAYQYPQQGAGAPGYGPAYTEQGQGQYPEQGQYPAPGQYAEQPQFGEQQFGEQQYAEQAAPYAQPGQVYEQQPEAYEQPPAYDQTQVYGQPQGQPQAAGPQGQGQAYGQQFDHTQWQLPPAAGYKPKGAGKAPHGNGFVSALFDFGFTSFVTPKIIKVLYVLATAWTILWALAFLEIGFRTGGTAGGLVVLIIADPILILLSLGIFRVVLEYFMVTFRMQEDVKALRERADADPEANAGTTESGANEVG